MKKRLLSLVFGLSIFLALSQNVYANNTKLVALTFDDGPHPEHTVRLLDELAARGVTATFFCTGKVMARYPDIVQRVSEEGHQIANHSFSHPFMTSLSAEGVRREVTRTNEIISGITGQEDSLFRTPYGAHNRTVLTNLAAPNIQWSVDPTEGNMARGEDAMYHNVLRTTHDGAIILLHDTNQRNINVAVRVMDALLAQGYEFVSVDELFRLRGVAPVDGSVYRNVPPRADEIHFDESRIAEHWGYTSLLYAREHGIMSGNGLGLQPNGFMTRAMAVTVLERITLCDSFFAPAKASVSAQHPVADGGTRQVEDAVAVFTDVPPDAWYSESVYWGETHGYIHGSNKEAFSPDDYVTKEAFYTMLYRLVAGKLGHVPAAEIRVYPDDGDMSAWAREAVYSFRSHGFVSANDREIFRPLDYMTRAEAAELVTWTLQVVGRG